MIQAGSKFEFARTAWYVYTLDLEHSYKSGNYICFDCEATRAAGHPAPEDWLSMLIVFVSHISIVYAQIPSQHSIISIVLQVKGS